jgi:chromosome segregation ATPase
MCKKLWIAALAVVVGLVVAGTTSTKFGSLVRLKWRKATDWAEKQVTPETELERLRLTLKETEQQDARFVDQIARLDQQVDDLKAQLYGKDGKGGKKVALDNLDQVIRARNASLTGTGEFVSYNGERYSRADMQQQVRLDAQRFFRQEAAFKAEEARLKELTETRDLYQGRLSELRTARQEMGTELQKLENTLLQERQAQIKNKVASDDGGLSQIRQDINKLRQRVDVMKRTRELQSPSDEGPVDRREKSKQRDTELDTQIQKRWGERAAPIAAEGGSSR